MTIRREQYKYAPCAAYLTSLTLRGDTEIADSDAACGELHAS
jgi:hypothetical protein